MKTLTGYHFTSDKLKNGELLPKIGEWLKHKGEIIPRFCGLHMSVEPWDALQYAPGNLLHKVELRKDLIFDKDKIVGRERKIIATIDAEKLLRQAARKFALDVIDLWSAPEVVKEYLQTGNEQLRKQARDAAASWSATRLKQRKWFNDMVYNAFKGGSKK